VANYSPKLPRRRVIDGYQTGAWFSNMYKVTLSCGHTNQLAQGRNGAMPKTSGCQLCYKEQKANKK
jgi:hypothetical protein